MTVTFSRNLHNIRYVPSLTRSTRDLLYYKSEDIDQFRRESRDRVFIDFLEQEELEAPMNSNKAKSSFSRRRSHRGSVTKRQFLRQRKPSLSRRDRQRAEINRYSYGFEQPSYEIQYLPEENHIAAEAYKSRFSLPPCEAKATRKDGISGWDFDSRL